MKIRFSACFPHECTKIHLCRINGIAREGRVGVPKLRLPPYTLDKGVTVRRKLPCRGRGISWFRNIQKRSGVSGPRNHLGKGRTDPQCQTFFADMACDRAPREKLTDLISFRSDSQLAEPRRSRSEVLAEDARVPRTDLKSSEKLRE